MKNPENLTPEAVQRALQAALSAAEAASVSGIAVRGERLSAVITIPGNVPEKGNHLKQKVEDVLYAIPGVKEVTLVLTAHHEAPASYTPSRERAQWNTTPIPHVKRIVAVASGKGGVGKSTTTVCLAHAMTALGAHVGILDADIYGPSIPRMLGIREAGQPSVQDGKMMPHRAHGIACMSLGFIVQDSAAILRGPMISKALSQMLRATAWGTQAEPLDMLLIDMPPGTGDIYISLAQQVPMTGAVLITTPQEVAVEDALKSGLALQKLHVPLLGVIENMSWMEDASGGRMPVFGGGGGRRLADRLHIPLLAEVPLHPSLVTAMERGERVPAVGVMSAAEAILASG